MKRIPFLAALLTASAFAADAPPRTEEQILKSVKLPEGYEASVFAMPPQGGYPTAVSASVDGVLFVAVDENGSLDAKPGRGRVVRMRDTDADGKADEFKVFAEMDSPRGVIWDGPVGAGPGTLYVMYPPKLTAFTDTDGDGKADKQEDILTGLGFDLKFRGADHTTNGCRLGIDGFIYIAVGDYGFINAKAKDGTTLTMRGGGIVRIRPDGTGFEIVSRGQRNIYDVAVSPTLDLFTRDNTNDGGGWDVRLSFVPPGAHMGYPTLFKNFGDEIVQPLAVLGGGSPCGALWLDEPGLQNGLYTVEWGRNAIMYHPLTANGAGFKQEQVEWLKMTRPTDMDVDASGALYIASWEGATFNYNGPNAGYVLRVVKKGNTAKADREAAVRDAVAKATGGKGLPPTSPIMERFPALFSESAVERLAAQREILASVKTKDDVGGIGMAIGMALADGKQPLAGRVNVLFLLAQLMRKLHPETPFNPAVLKSPQGMEEYLFRAMGDSGQALAAKADVKPLIAGLAHRDPRVRTAAITALRRLGRADATPQMLPLVADADPIVSHLAIRALSELKASSVLLGTLDSADAKVQPGALRALHAIYEPAVVDGLLSRLPNAKGELRRGILAALCRLDNQDAPYVDPKVWWGTRPDTSGQIGRAHV